MTYAVKTLYPEFKCLTAFRKVMKRIETAKGDGWKLRKHLKMDYKEVGRMSFNNGLWIMRFETTMFKTHYETLLKEEDVEWEKAEDDLRDEKMVREGISWLGNDDFDTIHQRLYVKFPMFYKFLQNHYMGKSRWIDWVDRGYPVKWLWAEQNKYDMMAKKWEFNQAMISRDYKTITLCDDVIGLVFEYL